MTAVDAARDPESPGFCSKCGAPRRLGDVFCGRCGSEFFPRRDSAASGVPWARLRERVGERWSSWPWPKWVAAALLVAYVIGFHPTVELQLPNTGECASGYSVDPVDNVCRKGGTSRQEWHVKGNFKREAFHLRTALYLETFDLRLFDFDTTAGRYVGLGRCGEDVRGRYSCT